MVELPKGLAAGLVSAKKRLATETAVVVSPVRQRPPVDSPQVDSPQTQPAPTYPRAPAATPSYELAPGSVFVITGAGGPNSLGRAVAKHCVEHGAGGLFLIDKEGTVMHQLVNIVKVI